MDLFFAGISNSQTVLCYLQMLDLLAGYLRITFTQQDA